MGIDIGQDVTQDDCQYITPELYSPVLPDILISPSIIHHLRKWEEC